MNRRLLPKILMTAMVVALASSSQSLFACAACFGKSDSRLAVGMNWGIFVLLGVVSCVLSGFAAAGIYIVKRSAAVAATTLPEQNPAPAPIEKV